jgi:hypothetical protein
MKKVYIYHLLLLCFSIISFKQTYAQPCAGLGATAIPYESRCAATGSIKVAAFGGSGSYKYKVTGTASTNFTSTDSITGLSAGTYTVVVNDIATNCTYNIPNVVVPGTYNDPRFTLFSEDVTCDNGSNGSISLNNQSFGRAPFKYSIIAPSPMGVGTTSPTGDFQNLKAGVYTIRLVDSCGGIQTRLVTINNYTWKIDSYSFWKVSCDTAKGFITASDNRGHISTAGGIPGFSYGIVRFPGDTIWSSNANFSFYLAGQSVFEVIVKDACGKIKKSTVALTFRESVSASVAISAYGCNTFTASLKNIVNFYKPSFCLYNDADVKLSCNTTGVFNNLNYGNYCIKAHDSCSDTTIIRCFNVIAPPVSVGNNVSIFNKTCNSFSAAINGQSGLTNAKYCLFDSADNQLACNYTGVFNNLSYGRYCINIKDSCRDTTIQRCFNPTRPMPLVPAVLVPSYYGCDNFGVIVGGDSLTNPRYCIIDINGNVLTCNYTGIFDSLQYGYYCIDIHDSCYDTTITRCISVLGPVIGSNITVSTSDQTCLNFTASVGGLWLLNPTFCLYTSNDVLLECNNNGIFYNLPYGSYYIKTRNGCPDTTFTTYFTELPPLPSLDANVGFTNNTCSTFSVGIGGPQNLNNPTYCLFDSSNVSIMCNSTGIFNNIAYGTYCIQVKDACYDTTITRCFTAVPEPINLKVTARKSCAYGFARFGITVNGSAPPVNIKIYNPDGSLFIDKNFNAGIINIDSIPGTLTGETYKIVAIDNCGLKDSAFSKATASTFTHRPVAYPKCPSSTWVNGSGSIVTTVASNTGTVTVKIIKKNSGSTSISPSLVSGGVYTFNNLAPARYIIRYSINDACGKYFYDTITIKSYQYPNLNRSSAYQCDVNGFTIGAVVSAGLGPFTYEIIGSSPASPSIVTSPQTDPEFSINNGTNYSLVRLRALDACGNATLQDASILPLANNGITATFNCFQLNSTLSVDTLTNATYAWHRKDNMSSTDSVYLDSSYSIYLPFVLPADTGIYVCNITVNNGCINRLYYFNLNGQCSHYLPLKLESFTGKFTGTKVMLNWKTAANLNMKKFVVERRVDNGPFTAIGTVDGAVNQASQQSYHHVDALPQQGKNYYRIKMVNFSNDISYSNEVLLTPWRSTGGLTVYPNPATDAFTIGFKTVAGHSYSVKVMNLVNQPVKEINFTATGADKLEMHRTNDIGSGIYFIKVIDINTNEELSQKVIFR